MTLTITHAKVDAIPDNAADAAAGKVLPSDWNADHIVSGTADASLDVGTTPITSGTDGAILYQGVSANSGLLEEDSRLNWNPSGQGQFLIGTATPISAGTFGEGNLELLGDVSKEITAVFAAQHPFGINFSLIPDAATTTDFWNIWVAPSNFDWPTHTANPSTIWDGKFIAGINSYPSGNSPIAFDPTTVYFFSNLYLNPNFVTGAGSFFDGTNHRLGINTNSPSYRLHITSGDNKNIVIASTNTVGCSFVLDNTGGGGHSFQFFSTGSVNGTGPGKFGVFDETGDATPLLVDQTALGILRDQVYAWNSDPQYQNGSNDTGASRVAATVIGIGNGTQGNTSGIVLSDGNRGSVQIDFGAFPGTTDTTLAVAVTQISSGSVVECFIMPAATTDHSVDEHWLDPPEVFAGSVNAGVGFTIYAKTRDLWGGVTGMMPTPGDLDNLVYGKWQLGWRWS